MMLKLTPFVFIMAGQGEVILHPIYIDDLVEAIIRSLERMETVDETIEIGGPEYITLEDLVRTVMRVSGAHRAIQIIPPYMMRWITTIYGLLFRRTLITHQWLDILAANRTARLGNIYHYFGFQPRRFEDTLLTYMPERHYFFDALRYAFRRRPRGL